MDQDVSEVLDSDGIVATRRVRCSSCETCWEHPKHPGWCIYGGPFTFVRLNAEM